MRTIIAVASQLYSLLAAFILFRWLVVNALYPWMAYGVIPFELFISYEIWAAYRRVILRNA